MKIISGGQTGADRAALDVAIELGIEYSGSIPKGKLAEDGIIDLEKYPNLQELKQGNYLALTRKNVVDSDATLAITDEKLTGGTKKTIEIAEVCSKPYLYINLKTVTNKEAVREILEWLNKLKPNYILNVAGPRELCSPGIYVKVYEVLLTVFQVYK